MWVKGARASGLANRVELAVLRDLDRHETVSPTVRAGRHQPRFLDIALLGLSSRYRHLKEEVQTQCPVLQIRGIDVARIPPWLVTCAASGKSGVEENYRTA